TRLTSDVGLRTSEFLSQQLEPEPDRQRRAAVVVRPGKIWPAVISLPAAVITPPAVITVVRRRPVIQPGADVNHTPMMPVAVAMVCRRWAGHRQKPCQNRNDRGKLDRAFHDCL